MRTPIDHKLSNSNKIRYAMKAKSINIGLLAYLFLMGDFGAAMETEKKFIDSREISIRSCYYQTENFVKWLKNENDLDQSRWHPILKSKLSLEKLSKLKSIVSNSSGPLEIGHITIKNSSSAISVPIKNRGLHFFLYTHCDYGGKLIGIYFLKLSSHKDFKKEIKDVGYEEERTLISSGRDPFEVSIIWPSLKPKAVVFFALGSGPTSKDISPYPDIAINLASHGIISVRIDKRSLTHPLEFIGQQFTPEDESIKDIVTSLKNISSDKHVRHLPIFLLGHSQGGILLPRVYHESGLNIVGMILLAAPSKSELVDRLIDQYKYLISHRLEHATQYREEISKLKESEINWEYYKRYGIQKGSFPLGLPADYLNYLEKLNPIVEVKKSNLPTLIMQGKDDYLVTMKDYIKWKKNLRSLGPRVTFKLYPRLNHSFTDSSIKSELVDKNALNDISKWILMQTSRKK